VRNYGIGLKYGIPFFTELHAMQTRSSDKKAVCLSVCPDVCRTRAL